MSPACDACLRRPWLLGELSGHLDPVRADIAELLALADDELIAAVGGRRRSELKRRLSRVGTSHLRKLAAEAGLELICRCDPDYPPRLRDLANPPAVLHVAGGLERFAGGAASEPVAIVGSRRASSYGTSVARSLGHALASAGVPVISGMAHGIDTAAHEGALGATAPLEHPQAPTLAVLAGSASEAYPRTARGLHRRILDAGAAISELPPRIKPRSWMFLARNRIIAALASMTIVVEAQPGSATLLTARYAAELGRPIGAVPGRVTTPQAVGPNRLIQEGAHLITTAQDVVDVIFEAGTRAAGSDDRPPLTGELRALLSAIEDGHDTPAALTRDGVLPGAGLAALASLELAGYVQRGAGGRFTIVP